MSFRENIPNIVSEHSNTSAFIDVLDGLNDYKTSIISEYIRSCNPALLTDKKWLIKNLSDYGITNIPLELPTNILIQMLLNADVICRTRGSKIGLELYCSVLSLGQVTIDDSEFYSAPEFITLDSNIQGFVTEDTDHSTLYIVDDTNIAEPEGILNVTISSKYFGGTTYAEEAEVIKTFIETTLPKHIGFSPRTTINYTYTLRSAFYYHELLNPYFHE